MKVASEKTFSINPIITLHNDDWLQKQRKAGKIAAQTLLLLQKEVKNKTTKSLIELNNLAEEFIIKNGGIPTFKNYKGFPAGVCCSVGNQLVHGIPTDYHLQEGDLVSFDLGATVEGAIADTAITCIYGQPKSTQHSLLVKATEEALMRAIASVQVGKKLGCIGNAISKCAKGYSFSVVEAYGGHGISMTADGIGIPHAPPFVSNKSDINSGIRIQPGLSIAIEPLLVAGSSADTYVDKDGWTVYSVGGISAHFEHTLYIHNNHVEIITDRSSL